MTTPASDASVALPASRWFRSLVPIERIDHPSVADRLQALARAAPSATAIERDGQQWSYARLDERANTIARALARQGVRCGEVVAIDGEATFDFVASLLGCWQAGAIPFPLDDRAPAARQARLLERAAARCLLHVGSAGSPTLPARTRLRHGLPVVGIADAPDESPGRAHRATMEAPDAYLFCSSGSTGEPKLIVGRHRGLAHFLDWQRNAFAIGARDRCLLTTATTFDVVLRDIFLVLCAGGTLHLPPPSPPHVFQTVQQSGITCLHTTPSRLAVWLATWPATHPVTALRHLFCAGEPLPAALAERAQACCPGATVVNLYGPTETTLAKFAYRVPRPPTPVPLPVGLPLPGVRAHVLDARWRPCAPGTIGEIAIQTPYRSGGYLGAPGLAAQRFFDIEGSDDGVYLTGDLGFFDTAGCLTVTGRKDDQIKIRGVLVQPAEVEACLEAFPGVRRAKVVPNGDDPMTRHLVAFFEPSAPGAVDPPALERHLAAQLPPPLRPRHCLAVPAMPLTRNGKVDKARLLAEMPTRDPAQGGTPRGKIEQALASLLVTLRSLSSPPGRDAPLDVDSLAAMALQEYIATHWHHRLTTADIVAADTLAALAARIAAGRDAGALPPADERPAICAFPPISGWGLIYRGLAQALPEFRVQAVDFDVVDAPLPHFARQAGAMAAGRPLTLLGYSAGGNLAFEVARQLESEGQSIGPLLLLDTAPRTRRLTRDAQDLERYADDFTRFLADSGFLDELSLDLPGRHDDLARAARERLCAYRRFLDGLVHAQPIAADIVLIQAAEGSEIDAQAVADWRQLTRGRVEVVPGHGDHLGMLAPAHAAANAAVIDRLLRSR